MTPLGMGECLKPVQSFAMVILDVVSPLRCVILSTIVPVRPLNARPELKLFSMNAGLKKFLISFDDGDEIWTGLPAKDVRPAMSDLATPGGIAREGVPVQVVRAEACIL